MDTRAPEINVEREDDLKVLRIILPETPMVTWRISIQFINGEPHARRLDYRATNPARPVAMPIKGGIPWARLVGAWCVFESLRSDGTPYDRPLNLWSVFNRPAQELPRAPQQSKTMSDDEHRQRMTAWSEPIAETMLAASSAGVPVRKAVGDRFKFGEDRAKQVMEIARDYHPYLPKRQTR